MKEQIRQKIRDALYMIIIGIISLIMLLFLPMVGSTIGLEWNIPDTLVGWIVYIATKLIMAGLNITIYYCFMEQAKINVKDDPNYKEAISYLRNNKKKDKKHKPLSPKSWTARQYAFKGSAIFITSALTTISLAQAILVYDLTTFLSYLFTLTMGIVFGIMQMKRAEEYWTVEFVEYVKTFILGENLEDDELYSTNENVAQNALKQAKKGEEAICQ